MLGFLMPADVRRNLIDAPMLAVWASCSQRPLRPRLDGDRHSDENSSPEVMSSLTSSGVTAERWRRRSCVHFQPDIRTARRRLDAVIADPPRWLAGLRSRSQRRVVPRGAGVI